MRYSNIYSNTFQFYEYIRYSYLCHFHFTNIFGICIHPKINIRCNTDTILSQLIIGKLSYTLYLGKKFCMENPNIIAHIKAVVPLYRKTFILTQIGSFLYDFIYFMHRELGGTNVWYYPLHTFENYKGIKICCTEIIISNKYYLRLIVLRALAFKWFNASCVAINLAKLDLLFLGV